MLADLPSHGKMVYVVYDVCSYSFETIFRLFSSHPLPNVYLGTYNEHTHTIITDSEILQ